jgi:hypothetical protein
LRLLAGRKDETSVWDVDERRGGDVTEVREIGTDAVEHYLACMAAHDWDGLAATIADEGLTRDGPFCDRVEGKQRYVDFLRGVITSLDGYQLQVQRVSHVSNRVSFVELSETFGIDGVTTTYPECILFERNDNGLIAHVSVFMKQPGAEGPVEGARAS